MAEAADRRRKSTESWKPFSRVILKATGLVACEHGRESSCRIEAAPLYNGRVLVQATIDGKSSQIRDWADRCQRFRISGTLDDGRELAATDIHWTNYELLPSDSEENVPEGFVGRTGCLEVSSRGYSRSVPQSVIYELTNARLDRRVGPVGLGGCGSTTTLTPSPDHRWVRRRMEALRTSGVLSRLRVEVVGRRPAEGPDDTAHALCGLLTLVCRSPVAIVGEHWDDPEQPAKLSRYREPPFLYAPIFRPMVSSEQLGEFLDVTYGAYVERWRDWDLPNAIDHYVQALALQSAWAQAVGFFTAMETLKRPFLHSQGRSEHDARGYATVVEQMINVLTIPADDLDVRNLIKLRDKIIHRGSPGIGETPWHDEAEAFRMVAQFGGLVESTILAILGYRGQFERYDQLFVSSCD